MGRLLIRNPNNTAWVKIEDTSLYVRDPTNTKWLRMYPESFLIRTSDNNGWAVVDQTFDPAIDDICEDCAINYIPQSCNAKPNNASAGSGIGNGSGGPSWDEVTGYPAGYDLPDVALSGFELSYNDTIPPTGRALRRPGLNNVESYDPVGVAAQTGLGIYANPNLERASVFGRGAAITETVYAVGLEQGFIEIAYASYSAKGISIDVYYRGIRIGSTCGRVEGRGRIKFPIDPVENDERIMIRVRGEEDTLWALQVLPQKVTAFDEYKNLVLNWFEAYTADEAPDLLTYEYLGTPAFPAPCHAAVWPIANRLQDNKYFEYYHYVGEQPGWMYLDYTSWMNADFVEVYHNGKRIATTLDAVSNKGFLRFYYDPKTSQCMDLMVRIGSKDFTAGNALSSVYYSLYCPSTRGAREYRHPCASYEILSAGHPTTEDCFDLSGQYPNDMCAVLIQVDAGSFSTKFEVFDVNDELLDSVNAKGRGTLEFWLPPSQAHKRLFYVRVTSAIGCDWKYYVRCAIQKPVIRVADYGIAFLCEEV